MNYGDGLRDGARVTVSLDKDEAAALFSMSDRDCRHPREQLRFLLRAEAQRRGLIGEGEGEGEAEPAGEPRKITDLARRGKDDAK